MSERVKYMLQRDSVTFYSFYLLVAHCLLLITFVNSLNPYQDWLNVGSGLDPNRFTPK